MLHFVINCRTWQLKKMGLPYVLFSLDMSSFYYSEIFVYLKMSRFSASLIENKQVCG